MKTSVVITIKNPYEMARLLSLIEDGKRILNAQGRMQRGIDGYMDTELDGWHKAISGATNIRCEFPGSDFKLVEI